MKYLLLGACALAFFNSNSAFSATQDSQQIECLANNIYWESRNQTLKGMMAVGLVTMNRVHDSRFPNEVCDVVYQGPTRPSWKDPTEFYPIRHRCQFSWYCDGKADDIPELDIQLFSLILSMAFKIYHNEFKDFTDGATHYHAYYVNPEWASTKTKTYRIDDHIFYRWEK